MLSRRNDPHVRLHGNQLDVLFALLLKRLSNLRKSNGKRDWGKSETSIQRHLNIITADLCAAWEADPELLVGYSRNHKEFKKGGSYYDDVSKNPLISRTAFLEVIDGLAELGYIQNDVAKQGGQGVSSRMKAKPKLIRLFQDNKVNWASITRDPDAEVLELRAKAVNGGLKRGQRTA